MRARQGIGGQRRRLERVRLTKSRFTIEVVYIDG